LGTPDARQGHVVPGMTALCMLIARLAHPLELMAMQELFSCHYSTISKIVKFMALDIHGRFGALLDYDYLDALTVDHYKVYANIIAEAGGVLPGVFG